MSRYIASVTLAGFLLLSSGVYIPKCLHVSGDDGGDCTSGAGDDDGGGGASGDGGGGSGNDE